MEGLDDDTNVRDVGDLDESKLYREGTAEYLDKVKDELDEIRERQAVRNGEKQRSYQQKELSKDIRMDLIFQETAGTGAGRSASNDTGPLSRERTQPLRDALRPRYQVMYIHSQSNPDA